MYALWIFASTMSGVRLDSSNVCLSATLMRPCGAGSSLGPPAISVPPGPLMAR
jgi:hypothetical protein